MPTAAHAPAAWVMGYDLYPLDTVATKQELLEPAIDEEWTVIFEHDPGVGAGVIRRKGRRVEVEKVLDAPATVGSRAAE
jgi:hypothetical protein